MPSEDTFEVNWVVSDLEMYADCALEKLFELSELDRSLAINYANAIKAKVDSVLEGKLDYF